MARKMGRDGHDCADGTMPCHAKPQLTLVIPWQKYHTLSARVSVVPRA